MRRGGALDIKTILKYFKRTKDIFHIYGSGELILEGYSSTSFYSDDDDAKSQLGFTFKLDGGVVAWKSSKKATTMDSTTEAEHESGLDEKLNSRVGCGTSIAEPVVIFCNNNGAITQAKEPRSHHCTKYILRCYNLLREMVSRGDVRMDEVSSAKNTIDPLTNPMSQIAHTHHLNKMGYSSMGD
ncbi:UNVERIFIED_CONTAM: hypothetical protein Slati_4428000 [Sesamum latifolium]|uniref:Uncharacterized protein n=1 Tax=Sesamum latifolium TaxID=2727402 RepID=A0AAW2SQD3_9LAMI